MALKIPQLLVDTAEEINGTAPQPEFPLHGSLIHVAPATSYDMTMNDVILGSCWGALAPSNLVPWCNLVDWQVQFKEWFHY